MLWQTQGARAHMPLSALVPMGPGVREQEMMATFMGFQYSPDESVWPQIFPTLLKLSPFNPPLTGLLETAQESCDLDGIQGDLDISGPHWVDFM